MKNKINLVLLLLVLFPMLYFITGWNFKLTAFTYVVLLGMGVGVYKYQS